MSTTTLSEVLRGCQPGRPQSVGLMTIIPLLSQAVDDRFAPLGAARVKTTDYGTLVFSNPSDAPLLIPRDAAYIVKRAAQDHALPHVGLVGAKSTATFETAACVQQTQVGLIQEGEYELLILPFPIREYALQVRVQRSYHKLWPAIGDFNAAMGLSHTGHVDVFLNHYQAQLEQFVAEFEPVPEQVGAIVIIGDRLAGIERTPNTDYWLSIWETLVRECYGSLALYFQKRQADLEPPRTRRPLEGQINSLADLATALGRAAQSEAEAAASIVRALLPEPLTVEPESSALGLQIETLTSDQFVGQVVKAESQTIYASLVATHARLAMACRQAEMFAI